MKKAVVSFADRTGSYQKKMQRLEQSLKGNFDGDFLGFTDYAQIGSPKHSEIPYAFKPYAIQKARDMGYDLILWADSPLWAVKSIQPVFDWIQNHGYVFFDNIGHPLGTWCNDRTLNHYHISREDSFGIKQIMACCFGLNFSHEDTKKMFGEYQNTDLYNGDWSNDDLTESKDLRVRGFRHDQALMSCIIHKYKKEILKGQDTFFAYYAHREVMKVSDSVCLYSG